MIREKENLELFNPYSERAAPAPSTELEYDSTTSLKALFDV